MAYTTTASVDYSQTAYDRLAYFAYRPELYYDRAVEVKPTRQAMPGSHGRLHHPERPAHRLHGAERVHRCHPSGDVRLPGERRSG